MTAGRGTSSVFVRCTNVEVDVGIRADDDAALYARARRGEREALAALVERHKDGLVRYLSRIAGGRERAEDVAQEAFLRLAEGRGNYRPERGQFRAYLYRIATNLVISRQRRRQRWQRLLPRLHSTNGHHQEPVQERAIERAELRSRLRAALSGVPVIYRSPLILHHLEGWTYAEIAAAMDCSVGTIKSRIFRARQQLQEALGPR